MRLHPADIVLHDADVHGDSGFVKILDGAHTWLSYGAVTVMPPADEVTVKLASPRFAYSYAGHPAGGVGTRARKAPPVVPEIVRASVRSAMESGIVPKVA